MIQPSGHRILVLPDKIENKSAGGIFIPEDVRDRDELAGILGTVVAIGPTAWQTEALGMKPWCKVGDRVAFAKYGGFMIKDPETDIKYRLINDEDICAVIS